MKLCSTKIYLEAGYKFLISHKVNNFMIDLLTEKIMIPYKLDELDKEIFLNLQVSTDSKCSRINIVKPEGVHDEFLTWKMFLPYRQIAESDNYLDEYLNCFFDAAIQVFREYDVDENQVLDVKNIVKAEVVNNPDYEYVEQYVRKVAKYDFD